MEGGAPPSLAPNVVLSKLDDLELQVIQARQSHLLQLHEPSQSITGMHVHAVQHNMGASRDFEGFQAKFQW